MLNILYTMQIQERVICGHPYCKEFSMLTPKRIRKGVPKPAHLNDQIFMINTQITQGDLDEERP